MLLQGGSYSALSFKDVTGSTPAQLALEKGHRYLGRHLAEYRPKHESGGWFGKNSKLSWLTSTQLCPVIWIVGLTLMALFQYKASTHTHTHTHTHTQIHTHGVAQVVFGARGARAQFLSRA